MRDYVIVTDSCCDFDRELIQSLDLTVIPLSVQLGADLFRNTPEEAPESHVFYTRLKQGEPAQTSAPNVEEFKQVFLPFLQQGKDVLYLGFSSALSGTYHNAAIAAQELAEEIDQAKVTAVDTLCASMGQGLLVDLAVQEKRKGKSLEEVRDFVLATMPRLCHWFTVGDLSQLRRGGRLSAGKAIVGNLLNIKPVLHVDDEGRLVPMEPETQRIYISHGDCLADAQALAAMIQERLHVVSVTIGDVGPVIGAHSGVGTLALFFLGTKR